MDSTENVLYNRAAYEARLLGHLTNGATLSEQITGANKAPACQPNIRGPQDELIPEVGSLIGLLGCCILGKLGETLPQPWGNSQFLRPRATGANKMATHCWVDVQPVMSKQVLFAIV